MLRFIKERLLLLVKVHFLINPYLPIKEGLLIKVNNSTLEILIVYMCLNKLLISVINRIIPPSNKVTTIFNKVILNLNNELILPFINKKEYKHLIINEEYKHLTTNNKQLTTNNKHLTTNNKHYNLPMNKNNLSQCMTLHINE